MIIYGVSKTGRIYRNEQPAPKDKANGEKVKVCRICGEELPLSQFRRQAKSIDGHCIYCKKCASAKERARYKEKGEK